MSAKKEIKNNLIKCGVNDLGKFGYPGVRPENILTDPIYSQFFLKSLEDAEEFIIDNKDTYANTKLNNKILEVIKELKDKIKLN